MSKSPVVRYNRHPPKSETNWGNVPATVPRPVCRPVGLGCGQHELPPPTVSRACLPRCGVCDLLSSCLHHSHVRPLFRRFDGLTIDNGGARLSIAPHTLPHTLS